MWQGKFCFVDRHYWQLLKDQFQEDEVASRHDGMKDGKDSSSVKKKKNPKCYNPMITTLIFGVGVDYEDSH